jgi:alpha-D-xyloside xylohydrolase
MLTIGERAGSFPGMVSKREFRIIFVKKDHGIGAGVSSEADRIVTYSGQQVQVAAN